MLESQLEEASDYILKAAKYLEDQGFENVQARIDGYEAPKSYFWKNKDAYVTPDLMADLNGKTYIFEIAMKADNENDVKSKWLFLKSISEIKGFTLRMFMPKGHVSFTRKLVNELEMKVNLIKI